MSGLASYVTKQLGLPTGILALDLVGQGCGTALPNMRTFEALLRERPRAEGAVNLRRDLQCGDVSGRRPRRARRACLFGDGAGAAVLTSEPTPGAAVSNGNRPAP